MFVYTKYTSQRILELGNNKLSKPIASNLIGLISVNINRHHSPDGATKVE